MEAASDKFIVYDEDSPGMTKEMLMQFKYVTREECTKQTIPLWPSPGTLNKAKALGKGYTSVLSRLLDLAIDDEEKKHSRMGGSGKTGRKTLIHF